MNSKVEQKAISWLQTGLLFCLIVYLAFISAQFVWFVLAPGSTSQVILPEVSSSVAKKKRSYSEELTDFHLFGEVGRIPVIKTNEPKVAPKTRLRLILKGVFTAEQGGESGAIVEEIGKAADYYGLGDTLPGNAVLEEVYSDRILLRRNGKLETLSFEDIADSSQNRIAKAAPPRQQQTRDSVKSPEEFITEATRQISENPEQALNSVGLAPASDGGYVYKGGNPMLSGLNLQKGDVIRSVNGHSLGDIKKDKDLMKGLYEQGSLEVEVARDGASFFINYPLR